eukprot:1138420-Prorocentrum_minimum.AAC.1
MMDQSDAGACRPFVHCAMLSIVTAARSVACINIHARVYSHGGPIGRRIHGYILMMDQSDAGACFLPSGPLRLCTGSPLLKRRLVTRPSCGPATATGTLAYSR